MTSVAHSSITNGLESAVAVPKEEAERRAMKLMLQAREYIAENHVFYGALQCKLRLKLDWRVKTMYTDAVVIGFNPYFVISREWPHLIYINVHEVTHDALGHPFRRGNRDPKLYGEAIDYVTNGTLNRDPELKGMCPPYALLDPRFDGMSVEQVYAILEREKLQHQPDPDEDGAGGTSEGEVGELGDTGSMGDCLDAGASGEPLPKEEGEEDDDEDGDGEGEESEDDEDEGEEDGSRKAGDRNYDEEEDESSPGTEDGESEEDGDEASSADSSKTDSGTEEGGDAKGGKVGASGEGGLDEAAVARLEREWSEAVMTAQIAAGGEVESGMLRALGQAQQCPKSFLEYMDEFAAKCCASESSWNKPARRFEPYLPSNSIPNVKLMVFGIDTSASVSAKELRLGEAATQRVMEEYNLRACVVVYCDDRVRRVERFEAGETITFENAKGGGNTAFHPVLQVVLDLERDGEEIAGVMYMTDLDGHVSNPEDFEHFNILWIDVTPRPRHRDPPSGLGSVCCIHD